MSDMARPATSNDETGEKGSPAGGSSAARRALVFVNRRSRLGADQAEAAIERLGANALILPQVVECGSSEEIAAEIRSAGGSVDLVVVGGGDGTLNAAAPALMETGLPLGILPLGTANDLARTLGIPADIGGAVAVIEAGAIRRIDLGEVNGHPFFNVASIGLSAELAMSLTREVKRRYGRLGYALTALRVLAAAEPFRAEIISTRERVRVLTLQIAVGNGRFYGGGMAVEKDAAIDDGRLDLYSLEMRRAWKLALMARAFRYGQHGAWRDVRADQSTEFEVRTRRPRAVNADGEIITQTPARFRVLPRAVSVFAPAEAPGLKGGAS